MWGPIDMVLKGYELSIHGPFMTSAAEIWLPGRQMRPWIHRATQGPTTDGPFGDHWIL